MTYHEPLLVPSRRSAVVLIREQHYRLWYVVLAWEYRSPNRCSFILFYNERQRVIKKENLSRPKLVPARCAMTAFERRIPLELCRAGDTVRCRQVTHAWGGVAVIQVHSHSYAARHIPFTSLPAKIVRPFFLKIIKIAQINTSFEYRGYPKALVVRINIVAIASDNDALSLTCQRRSLYIILYVCHGWCMGGTTRTALRVRVNSRWFV